MRRIHLLRGMVPLIVVRDGAVRSKEGWRERESIFFWIRAKWEKLKGKALHDH